MGSGLTSESRRSSGAPRGRRFRPWLLLGVLGAAVLLAALAGHQFRRNAPPALAPVPSVPRVRPVVAVLPFRNLNGSTDARWLSVALPEALGVELGFGETWRLVPADSVARLCHELGLREPDLLEPSTLARFRQNLGTDIVVLGSYAFEGEDAQRLRVDVRLQGTPDGGLLSAVSELGGRNELLDLVARTGTRLREGLQLSRHPPKGGATRPALPDDPRAARAYAEGLAHLRAFDALEARDLLERAVAMAPAFPLAHAALGEAWALLGYDVQAREALRRGLALSDGLPREAGLALEARLREATAEWDEAVRLYGELFSLNPDSIDYGLRLAEARAHAGQGHDALATIDLLRGLPPPAPLDPRLDLVLADVSAAQGDYRASVLAARRAAARAEGQGAALIVARARVAESYALGLLGEIPESRRAAEEAREGYERVGDRGGLAWATHRIAATFLQEGRLVEALRIAEQGRAAFEAIGYKSGLAAATNNVGYTRLLQGRFAEATDNLRQAIAIDDETGDRRGRAQDLANLGLAQGGRGALDAAIDSFDQSIALAREVADKTVAAVALQRRASMLAFRGETAPAAADFEAALAPLRTTERQRYLADALAGLGDVLALRGDREGARRRHEEARAIRRALRDRFALAHSELALAALKLADGDAEQAAAAATAVIATAAEEQARDLEILGLATRARAQLAAADREGALATLGRMDERVPASENPWVRGQASLAAAEVLLAAGRPGDARHRASRALAEATGAGLGPLALHARMALLVAQGPEGDASRRWAALEALREEAVARGWSGLAEEARRLLLVAGGREEAMAAALPRRTAGRSQARGGPHGSEEEGR